MNYRIITFILVGAVISVFGWQNSRRLAEVRQSQKKVMAEAMTLGISLNETGEVSHKSKIRTRDDESKSIRMISQNDINYMKFQDLKKEDRTITFQQNESLGYAMDKRLRAMTPAQIRKYIAE